MLYQEENGNIEDIEVIRAINFDPADSILGPIPGLRRTFEGHYLSERKTDTTFIIREDLTLRNSIAFVTGVRGRFDGNPEIFQIGNNSKLQWTLRIAGGAAKIGGAVTIYSNLRP